MMRMPLPGSAGPPPSPFSSFLLFPFWSRRPRERDDSDRRSFWRGWLDICASLLFFFLFCAIALADKSWFVKTDSRW